MNALVSVVVPTLNRATQLTEALASVAGQRGIDPSDVEVVVVNDGGAPVSGSVDRARALGLSIQLVNHEHRRGLPSARNTGLELARGTYVAFLDDDDVLLPNHLATALAALDSGTDIVATTCLVADRKVDPTTPVAELLSDTTVWDVAFDQVLLEACNLFPVHAAVLRRPPAHTARFDPALPAIEDWDFWLRLTRNHGYRVRRATEPTVIYHRIPHAGSMISAVAANTAAMAEFGDLVLRIWARWPATTARSQRFRMYVSFMYWQVLSHLSTGRAPNPHYYQESVSALARAWLEPDTEPDLTDQLAEIVTAGEREHR